MNIRFALSLQTAVLVLSLIAACLLPLRARAEYLQPPQQVVNETSEKIREALARNNFRLDFQTANRIVRDILEPRVDFNRSAALILGKHWRTATPGQRERFKNEFRTLLIRTYTTAFTEYKNWEIRHLPLQMTPGDKTVVVRTEIVQPSAQPVAVNYRMVNDGGQWKAYDVIIEGISLVQNYRTTFGNDIARTGSLDGVLKQLADRNAGAGKEPLEGSGS